MVFSVDHIIIVCHRFLFILFFHSLCLPFVFSQLDSVMNAKLMFMGFFNNSVPFTLVAYAERSINSGVASILDSTIPLFALIFAHFFLHGEKMQCKKVLGLMVGFGGVVLVCMQQVIGGEPPNASDFIGYAMVTGASASYAIASGESFLLLFFPVNRNSSTLILSFHLSAYIYLPCTWLFPFSSIVLSPRPTGK